MALVGKSALFLATTVVLECVWIEDNLSLQRGAIAQTPSARPVVPPILPAPILPPEITPQPIPQPPLRETPTPSPQPILPESEKIVVSQFEYRGNTIFTAQELNQVTAKYIGRPVTFNELLQARSDITQLYVDKGYVTSAAYIPVQENEQVLARGGTVVIRIVEGRLEQINVIGADRLANYVRSRLAIAAEPVLNEKDLTEALRLLQVNPLIQSISGRLEPGTQTGLSVLTVRVDPAPTFQSSVELNNRRSPTVGTFERQLQLSQANLLGVGDRLQVGYANTDGSNEVDINYAIPVSSRNTTLLLRYSGLWGRVIEEPFDVLDIRSNSRIYELGVRHPLFQRATSEKIEELAIGLTTSRIESDTSILGVNFPLSPGADNQGRTRLSVLRFYQEYTRQSNRQVILLRSQFNFGLNVLSATTNDLAPDGYFFAWRGQVGFLQRIGQRPYLLLRSDLQIADRPLVPLEQFSIGGVSTVRGYRQDAILGDSGITGAIEIHFPVLQRSDMELQLFPFVDVGHVWGQREFTGQSTLASVGLGLQWNWGNLSVNLSYGMPLISIPRIGNTLQEEGFNASISYFFRF